MAKQCGINLFVGTRYGCTGYIMDGLPYIRRRSSLDGDDWKKSAAFVRTREASVVFGGASALAGQIWRGIPRKMKGLMDAGAYNRLVVAVQQTHLQNGASFEFRQGRGKVQAHYAKVVERFEGKHLGKALNGMDLSDGALLADGVQLGANCSLSQRDPSLRSGHGSSPELVFGGKLNPELERKSRGNFGLGEFFHLEGAEGVSLHGLENLVPFVPDGAAVRVRLHVARVEALPHRWDSCAKRYLSVGRLQGERAYTASPWTRLSSSPEYDLSFRGKLGPECDSVSVSFPGRIVAQGDEERWFLNFVALEVGIRIGDGRWRRLDSACKSYVVCNMQGGETTPVPVPTPSASETGVGSGCEDNVAIPLATEAGVGSGVVPSAASGWRGMGERSLSLGSSPGCEGKFRGNLEKGGCGELGRRGPP